MIGIRLNGVSNTQQFEELIKVFLRPEEYMILTDADEDAAAADEIIDIPFDEDKNVIKQVIYRVLSEKTGERPSWGIMTGIRPVKLAGELTESLGLEETKRILRDHYYLSEENTDLITDMYSLQQEICGRPAEGSIGVYVGIPFCPTRCLYCSFASNQVGDDEITRYLAALHKEIDFAGGLMKDRGLFVESLYIGGGTPTTLSAAQLDELLQHLRETVIGEECRELTLEAGRPDTITPEKLRAAKAGGVTRISINPQTMKDETLRRIGRDHDTQDIRRAFIEANEAGFNDINADIIAGLPGEDLEDFRRTLDQLMDLSPTDVTVHSLAVKRASRLAEEDKEYHYRHGEAVKDMVSYSRSFLRERGYRPYYLYRQKHMSGAQDNTGYAKPGAESIYNIRIMDEHQSILALGAGGISKVYYPAEDRLERVANVTNYQIYIERLEEMMRRKSEGFPLNEQEDQRC